MVKILIVKLSAFGDIIHSLVVLQFIKQRIKDVKIEWLVDESFKDVLKKADFLDSYHTFALKKIKKEKNLSLLFDEIKKIKNLGKYDYIIDMQGLIKSAILSRIVGKNVYGFDKNSTRESFASFFYYRSFSIDYSKNVILRGVELINKTLDINITKKDLLSKKPLFRVSLSKEKIPLIIIVGASWKSKIYPPLKYANILNTIKKEALLIWGNEEERQLALQIAKHSKYGIVCKKLDILSLIDTIAHSQMVLGADTGPTHLAWALNVASITIFGPTPYFRNTLQTDINKVVFTKEVDPLHLDKNDFSICDIQEEKIIQAMNNE